MDKPNQPRRARVLLVEDSPSLAAVYQEYLRRENCQVEHVETGRDALTRVVRDLPDVLLLDLRLPDMSGMEVLQQIHEQALPTSVIVITAHGSVDVAVDAMRYGAFDFLVKPFDAKRLTVTLRNALERLRLSRLVETYEDNFARRGYHGFIGSSLPMQAAYRIIESAAPSKATVFITGESGTGKEVCAEAIHRESPRRDAAFVALNCAAIPRDLMESEIFGHVRGAFTGAVSARDGAASRADGGTLFLDEVCEMDLDLQSKLLRFIQTSRFQKVGGTKEEAVDVRIVCATNRDPLEEVRAGRFREDLFYRLHVIPLQLPPLRERGRDSVMIAQALLKQYAQEEQKRFSRFTPEVEERLQGYAWPGNVRELQNVIRNVVVLYDGETVGPEMLPPSLQQSQLKTASPAPPPATPAADLTAVATATTGIATAAHEIRPLWLEEKAIIERAIELCGGNVPKAAAMLEISASTIYRKRQSWEAASATA
jgi:DNA-binding NtrC family response regulator